MSTIKFNTDDFDKFDKQIDAALDDMNVKGLHDIIGEAAAFLDDDDRYDGNVNPTHISNATATICRAARRLMLAALPSNPVVKNIGNRGTEGCPFGDITFTDGARVGYALMPDGFKVFEMETFGAPEATSSHVAAAEAYIMSHYIEASPTTV